MKFKIGFIALLVGLILASCSVGNDVVNGRGIQKRKYNDGYYISWKNNFKKTGVEEIVTVKSENENVSEGNNNLKETAVQESENSMNYISENKSENFELTQEEVSISTESIEISNPLVVTKPSIKKTHKPGRVFAKVTETKTIETGGNASSDVMIIVLVILCFIIPPLAVFIFEGASSRFWIDLILFIIGIAVIGWLLSGISGLALLVSVIYALLIVLSVI